MRLNSILQAAREELGKGLSAEYLQAFKSTLDIDPVPSPPRKPRPPALAVTQDELAAEVVAAFVERPSPQQRPSTSPCVSPGQRMGRPHAPASARPHATFSLPVSARPHAPASVPASARPHAPLRVPHHTPHHVPASVPTSARTHVPADSARSTRPTGRGSPSCPSPTFGGHTPRSPSRSPTSCSPRKHARQRGRRKRWPPAAERSYYEAVEFARASDGPTPFLQWPFAPIAAPVDTAPSSGVKPSVLGAPRATAVTHASSRLTWSASDPDEGVSGYEIEIADVDALRGQQPWRRVHRGAATQCEASVSRGVCGVRARVRAYSSHGKGEWSESSRIIKLAPPPAPSRVEISQIPRAWLAVDLGGLSELSERNDAANLAMTKEELLHALHEHRTVLKVAFRFYALAGVSNVDDDPNTMTMVQFCNFVRASGLLGPTLAPSDVDRIFLRATRTLPPSGSGTAAPDGASAPNLLSAAATTSLRIGSDWKKAQSKMLGVTGLLGVAAAAGGGGAVMSQPQFVGALVRLAAAKYPEAHFSLGDKVHKLCASHVSEHVLDELRLTDDELSARMRSHLMGAVLQNHTRPLTSIFNAYAAADQSSAQTRRTTATMNVRECQELCEDVSIFDLSCTARDLLHAFVMVNLDDDVYEQDDASNTPSELIFEEFEEVVVRLFLAAVWRQACALQNTASLLDQDGDGDLDDDDLDELFDECDADGSGSISLEELAGALGRRLNAAAADAVAKQLVSMADEDGSGSMSREELREAVRKLASGKGGGSEREAGALERALDSWLRETFIPSAQKAMAKKKMKGA